MLTALVGVVALVAVLCFGLLSSDDASGVRAMTPHGSDGDSGALVGDSGSGGTSGQGGVAAGSDGSGSGSTAEHPLTVAYLRANFPLPPGAVPDTEHQTGTRPPHAKWYQIHASLESINDFYVRKLRTLGLPMDHPAVTTAHSTGKVVGYMYGYTATDPSLIFSLSLQDNFYSDAPGVVQIHVKIK